jgi:hypothetical protein
MARLRAEIDVEVAVAYGLLLSDMELVLSDFPLLDRGQPPLVGELRSTITRDLVLLTMAKRMRNPQPEWENRVRLAEERGAVAYVASEVHSLSDEGSPMTGTRRNA